MSELALERLTHCLMAGFLRPNPHRYSVLVDGIPERGKAADIPADELRVAVSDGAEKVVDLNCENSTALAQILDRPSGGRRIENRIAGVDVGAGIQQNIHNPAIAGFGGVVQSGRSIRVTCMDELGLVVQDCAHAHMITGAYGNEQLFLPGRHHASRTLQAP